MQIKLDALHIRQGDFHLSADLVINEGITAIIGPSGEGKSTLLLTLAGFVEASSGEILFGDKDCTNELPSNRPVTMLFQENNLFPHLNVFANTALGLRADLKLSPVEKEAVLQALAKTGLAGMGERMPDSLSGGQRQRVAIARALLRNQPVLLLDEPFAALGPALRHEMLDLIVKISKQENATVLMVTHNPDDALRIADKTIVVAGGRATAPIETRELFTNPSAELSEYLGK